MIMGYVKGTQQLTNPVPKGQRQNKKQIELHSKRPPGNCFLEYILLELAFILLSLAP